MPPTRLSRKKRATTTRRILFLNEFSSLHKTWRLTMGLCNNCMLAVKTALGHQRIVPWYKPIVKSSCSLLILILHKWKVMVSTCSKAIARRQSTPHASTHRSILGFVSCATFHCHLQLSILSLCPLARSLQGSFLLVLCIRNRWRAQTGQLLPFLSRQADTWYLPQS